DQVKAANVVCAPKDPGNDCDLPDTCDGSNKSCVAKSSDDGTACTTPAGDSGTCQQGQCVVSGGTTGGTGGTGTTSGSGGSTTVGAGGAGGGTSSGSTTSTTSGVGGAGGST